MTLSFLTAHFFSWVSKSCDPDSVSTPLPPANSWQVPNVTQSCGSCTCGSSIRLSARFSLGARAGSNCTKFTLHLISPWVISRSIFCPFLPLPPFFTYNGGPRGHKKQKKQLPKNDFSHNKNHYFVQVVQRFKPPSFFSAFYLLWLMIAAVMR